MIYIGTAGLKLPCPLMLYVGFVNNNKNISIKNIDKYGSPNSLRIVDGTLIPSFEPKPMKLQIIVEEN